MLAKPPEPSVALAKVMALINLLLVKTLASLAVAPVYAKVSEPTPVEMVTAPVKEVLPS